MIELSSSHFKSGSEVFIGLSYITETEKVVSIVNGRSKPYLFQKDYSTV